MPYFVEVDEARRIAAEVLSGLPLPAPVEVALSDAHGRILAADLHSLVDDPPFDNSAMDGFAMRESDVPTVPTTLPIQSTVAAAAHDDMAPLEPGHAVRIMTGAPMPPGADAILPIERCDVGDGEVTLTAPVRTGFVRKQGENCAKGPQACLPEPTSRLRRSASAPPWAIRPSRYGHASVSPSSPPATNSVRR